jgi:hypothetical protein
MFFELLQRFSPMETMRTHFGSRKESNEYLGRSASISRDGLPKLNTVSFWVGKPAEPSKIVAFAFGIDRDTFVCQTVQHPIEVIHLEVDHRFLNQREVFIILPEEGEDNLSALRRGRKSERPFGPR